MHPFYKTCRSCNDRLIKKILKRSKIPIILMKVPANITNPSKEAIGKKRRNDPIKTGKTIANKGPQPDPPAFLTWIAEEILLIPFTIMPIPATIGKLANTQAGFR